MSTHKSKADPGRGVAGNAHRREEPLRQWSAPSYNATTGRAHSSVDAQNSSEHIFAGNHAGKCSAQIPGGFDHIDKRRTNDPTPVRKRPFTQEQQ